MLTVSIVFNIGIHFFTTDRFKPDLQVDNGVTGKAGY